MFKVLDSIEDWFLASSLAAMLLINFSNVVSRYVINLSIAATEELTTNLFVWSCFIGAAAAAKRGAHLGLSLLTDKFPANVQRVVGLIVTMLTLAMFAVMIVMGVDMIQSQMRLGQTTPALGIPEWLMGLSIPVGGLFCFVRFAQAGWQAWKKGSGNR